jgi:DNA-binding NarL/FixJ family response regulator
MACKEKHQIIILEDRLLLYEGIKEWLRGQEGYELICYTEDWTEFKEATSSNKELIVITTLQYIKNNPGFRECSEFLTKNPSLQVICLNHDSRDIESLNLFESKISGIISLTAKKEEFLFGLENVANGRFYISTLNVSESLVNQKMLGCSLTIEDISLTPRELEILELISLGFNDKEIGEHINLSKRTIDGYRNSLLFKFGVRNTAQLIRNAFEKNFLGQ